MRRYPASSRETGVKHDDGRRAQGITSAANRARAFGVQSEFGSEQRESSGWLLDARKRGRALRSPPLYFRPDGRRLDGFLQNGQVSPSSWSRVSAVSRETQDWVAPCIDCARSRGRTAVLSADRQIVATKDGK